MGNAVSGPIQALPVTVTQGGTGVTTVAGIAGLLNGQALAPASVAATGAIAATTAISTSAGPVNIAGGNLDVQTAGKGLAVAEGSNAKQGTATLTAGTVVVANTSVTATSRITVNLVSLGTVTVPSAYGCSARTAGTSFTILASQATDTSVVWYELIEVG